MLGQNLLHTLALGRVVSVEVLSEAARGGGAGAKGGDQHVGQRGGKREDKRLEVDGGGGRCCQWTRQVADQEVRVRIYFSSKS